MTFLLERIVSGGQTGVDRAALDAAMRAGRPCAGWCPAGRRAEDGRIPDRYPLVETGSRGYAVRTERNVIDSDGTLILAGRALTGGTALTRRLARRHGRPWLVADPFEPGCVAGVVAWLRWRRIATLNVAGPRESQHPGIHRAALEVVGALLEAKR